MALLLDEIDNEIYRPTPTPKRKNAASTYARCSRDGWLASKDLTFNRESQRLRTNLSQFLELLVGVKCRWHEG